MANGVVGSVVCGYIDEDVVVDNIGTCMDPHFVAKLAVEACH